MPSIQRLIVLICSVLILVQAIVLWAATGSTNATNLAVRSSTGQSLPVASPAIGSNTPSAPFAFGLLPAPDPTSPEMISLATVGAPALVMVLMMMLPARKAKGKG